jgi:hypothetical protein
LVRDSGRGHRGLGGLLGAPVPSVASRRARSRPMPSG